MEVYIKRVCLPSHFLTKGPDKIRINPARQISSTENSSRTLSTASSNSVRLPYNLWSITYNIQEKEKHRHECGINLLSHTRRTCYKTLHCNQTKIKLHLTKEGCPSRFYNDGHFRNVSNRRSNPVLFNSDHIQPNSYWNQWEFCLTKLSLRLQDLDH